MKKLLTLLLSVIIAVGVFAMAGCGDDKAVTYTKATEEQKTTVASRLSAIADAEDENEEVKGLKVEGNLGVNATVSLYGSDTNVNAELNFLLKNENLDRAYLELAAKFNGNDLVSASAYVDKDAETEDYAAYISANASGAKDFLPLISTQLPGGNIDTSSVDLSSVKAKLLLSDIMGMVESEEASSMADIEGRLTSLLGVSEDGFAGITIGDFLDVSEAHSVELDMSDVVYLLNNFNSERLEVYVGSDDSIKLAVNLDNITELIPGSAFSAEIYIKLGSNNDYKVDAIVNFTLKKDNVNLSVTFSVTITPSTESIALPSDIDSYQYINPAELNDQDGGEIKDEIV